MWHSWKEVWCWETDIPGEPSGQTQRVVHIFLKNNIGKMDIRTDLAFLTVGCCQLAEGIGSPTEHNGVTGKCLHGLHQWITAPSS